MWFAPDSSKVLGIGQTPESAYREALARHSTGGEVPGFPAAIDISHYPDGANPLLPIAHGLRTAFPKTVEEQAPPEVIEPKNKVRALKPEKAEKAEIDEGKEGRADAQ